MKPINRLRIQVEREMSEAEFRIWRKAHERDWINGMTTVIADVFRGERADLYRKNWDGYRTWWKMQYRRKKHGWHPSNN
jgi:hypothetical protein